MEHQDLIDFCNEQIALVEIVIQQKEAEKVGIDGAINEANKRIDEFNAQKDQADIDIASYNDKKSKIKEIITILSS